MTSITSGQFYRTCEVFPSEMNGPSPCKSQATPLVGSPRVGVPLRVSEDTSMWFTTKDNRVKIAKGRICYLAEYDASSQVGVVFLCTASGFTGVNANRFIPVYGGPVGSDGRPILEPPSPMLHTVPPDAFSAPFYLNISHPLRVRVVHVISGSFNVLKNSVLRSPPPPVGMQGCRTSGGGPSVVRLHPHSELEFWQFHRRYHRERPPVGAATIGGGGGGAVGGGAMGGGGVAATDATQYLLPNGEWERGVAPWGRIGQFRIGFDVPLVLDTPGSDSDSDDEDDLSVHDIVGGALCLGDLDSPSTEEAKEFDLERVWLNTSGGAFDIY